MTVSEPQFALAAPHAANARRGVFETLLVVDGRPQAADRHLERLRASMRTLAAAELPRGLEDDLAAAAAGHALARLRVQAVATSGAEPDIAISLTAVDPAIVLPVHEVMLATVAVAGGAGPDKLIDRSWFEQAEALAGPGVRPLLVAASGALLETTRANVFLLRDGRLATPPLDGAILPGTVRAAVIDRARELGIDVSERPLSLEALEQADIVLLSGSVRLLERARVRAGRRASTGAAARLAAALAADAGL